MKKGHFRLTCVAQKRCCLSSLIIEFVLVSDIQNLWIDEGNCLTVSNDLDQIVAFLAYSDQTRTALVSLAAVFGCHATLSQKSSFGGALRDIQKTVARRTRTAHDVDVYSCI